MRLHGPLTVTSAFIFEAFYGELRQSFTPGTTDPLKQIFQKILMKRALIPHSCAPPIHYSQNDTNLECNSLIYVHDSKGYNLYEINKITNTGKFLCLKYGKYPPTFSVDLPWTSVGVFQKGPLTDTQVEICPKNVSGKMIKVSNLLITCPKNVLREK